MKAISVIATAGVAAGLLLTSAGAATKGGSISLVAYSTPKEAYGQLISAFGKTKAGKGVDFTQSYGASGDQAQAVVNLSKLFHHVGSQDKSAREALQTFLSGRGDVMLAYENEAILARRKGQPVYYLIPKATIRIENPVAVTTKASPAARAFVGF